MDKIGRTDRGILRFSTLVEDIIKIYHIYLFIYVFSCLRCLTSTVSCCFRSEVTVVCCFLTQKKIRLCEYYYKTPAVNTDESSYSAFIPFHLAGNGCKQQEIVKGRT